MSELNGQTVLVTRSVTQAGSLAARLSELGASVILHPVIEIFEPSDWREVDQSISALAQYGWIVFASTNGVRFFLQRCRHLGTSLAEFPALKIAAIGSQTALALQAVGLMVHLIPAQFDSSTVADNLLICVRQEAVLLVRANRGSEEMGVRLKAAKIPFSQIAVYQSVDVQTADTQTCWRMERGEIDWVTITSSAIAVATVRLFGERLRQVNLASISPTTSSQLTALGFAPTVEAVEFNMAGLIRAMWRGGN